MGCRDRRALAQGHRGRSHRPADAVEHKGKGEQHPQQ
jgi:hypothetical protein